MTSRDLAAPLGISYQQLNKYEVGIDRLSTASLFKVAIILQVEIDEFFPPYLISKEENTNLFVE